MQEAGNRRLGATGRVGGDDSQQRGKVVRPRFLGQSVGAAGRVLPLLALADVLGGSHDFRATLRALALWSSGPVGLLREVASPTRRAAAFR